MRQEEQLKEKYGTDAGYRVPDGYFESLRGRVMESLPEWPEAPAKPRLTPWQKVKPYVYLAAMFAGIWLMMHMFHDVAERNSLSLDNPPAAIAAAMAVDGDDAELYYDLDDDYRLESEISDTYDNIEDFAEDFGYEFRPEYASMEATPATVRTVSV